MKLTNLLNANGFPITNLANGVNAQDAVTFAQLSAAQMGWSWKQPVRAATTANITLSGLQTIDTVSLVVGDRVLVKNQTTGSTNTIYLAATGAWTPAPDAALSSEMLLATAFISEGTQGNTSWTMTTDGPINFGTTNLLWTQTGGGANYTPGNGVLFTSGIISVDPTVTARKSSATIGDGVTTTITFTHGLGTRDVLVSVQEVATNTGVIVDWVANGTNTVQVTFGVPPTTGQYRITVIA